MSQMKYALRNGELIIKKALVSPESLALELQGVPRMDRKLARIYKELFKLRHVIDHRKQNQVTYEALLRRNFSHVTFINRRKMIMPDLQELSDSELITRLVNTVAFVFNSTVKANKETKPVLFFQDIKEASTDTIEKSIVNTVLQMDMQKPNEIKYDFQYDWLQKLQRDIAEFDSLTEKAALRSKSKMKHNLSLNYIGFKQYEETVMRLNESLQLCL